jgi:HEAT repeat protein
MSREERLARVAIYLKTLAVAIAYVLVTVLTDVLYVKPHIPDSGLAFGFAFCIAQNVFIALLLGVSFSMKFVRRRRALRWQQTQPLILDKISAHLAGMDRLAELRLLQKRRPREIERCVFEVLCAVQGEARLRLSGLAGDLGLTRLWEKQFHSRSKKKRRDAISRLGLLEAGAGAATLLAALSDAEDVVKLEASRSLLRTGGPREIVEVFRAAVRESLLVRAILTEGLRPHAMVLCEKAVPVALASTDVKAVVATIEIVSAWGKCLPLPDLEPLIRHEDAAVRAAALALVPQVGSPKDLEPELVVSLLEENETVRAAAARAAGKLRSASTVPALAVCLAKSGAEATLAAAYALAQSGPEGCRVLEQEVLRTSAFSASAALEALEQVKAGRLLPGSV